ncbi:hypothetical protein R3W88_024538 [Solanum pinnatisectum]|uniref:Retrotransposon gag domain-containing protein n=1 Tax=Solanum pinnatisectum TaxID=50273 RepID=A0AAV9M3L6_9SOLN|nr:hypothetical protein R3W88_024538 [Solanum pinnatisectum]
MINMFSLRKNHPSSHPTTWSISPHPTIWSISPHPIPTHTLSQQLSPTRLNFDALQYGGIHDKMKKSKLDVIQQKMHDLEKKVNGGLNSKPTHDLRYKKLFLHLGVELPLGFKIPKFNMFNGHGDPVAHLKDFCSRLVGLENNEALLIRLFIQSLSGIAFTWYVKQDFDKWLAWEDMAREFVEQYKKLSHEYFEEYLIRWRMKASKIRHSPHEVELVQTLIKSLDGIYYKILSFAGIQSFDSVIRIGKELEYGIQSGRIVDAQTLFQVLKNPSDERSKNVSTTIHMKQSNQSTKQVHAIFDSCGMRFKPYNPQVTQHKVRKPRVFTPLMETLTSIFQRLWAKGLLKPREGWIPKHSSSTLDLSKNYVYHSNIQGHDTKECLALRNKIQNMIEKGKIIMQQGPLNNNYNPSSVNAVIVQ